MMMWVGKHADPLFQVLHTVPRNLTVSKLLWHRASSRLLIRIRLLWFAHQCKQAKQRNRDVFSASRADLSHCLGSARFQESSSIVNEKHGYAAESGKWDSSYSNRINLRSVQGAGQPVLDVVLGWHLSSKAPFGTSLAEPPHPRPL